MKLYTAEQIRRIDHKTIENGTTTHELIQRASIAFINWFIPKVLLYEKIIIICGTGNNGADGLEIAYQLICRGYEVSVYCLEIFKTQTDAYHFFKAKAQNQGLSINVLNETLTLPVLPEQAVIIDAIFGNGLSRALDGNIALFVKNLNSQDHEIYAVDIPTGMRADGMIEGDILKCKASFAFEFPKLSFFVRESEAYVGKWNWGLIGLSQEAQFEIDSPFRLLQEDTIKAILKPRSQHSHKGVQGQVQLIGGQEGMAGAILLSAKAAINSGVGLCSVSSEELNRQILQGHLPQAMFVAWNFSAVSNSTIGIGPGLGQSAAAQEVFKYAVDNSNGPLVIDADGLNFLSQNEEQLRALPALSILTPHTGEFHRLFGNCSSDWDRWKLQIEKSQELNLIIVLKGRHSTISDSEGNLFINSTGNPGMATGGSGDVLTGIISSFLAQGYTSIEAAQLGVFIHGRSGDLAAKALGQAGMTALDICNYISQALKELE